jgi:hypothetical protein
MALPKAVREAGEKADAAAKALVAERTGEGQGQPPQAQSAKVSPIQSEQQNTQQSAEGGQQTWEQRYKTLQGMYNADRERWQQDSESKDRQISRLADSVADLSEKMSEMESQKAPAASIQNLSYQDMGLSEEQVEEIGEDMLGIMRTMATNIAQNIVGQVDKKVTTMGKRQEETARDVFFRVLGESVPDWRVLNEDKGFLAWLAEPDGLSGVARRENLGAAYNAVDADTVIRYFKAYKEASGSVAADTPDFRPGQNPESLHHDEGPEPVTRTQIKQVYKDISSGRLKGEEATAAQKRIDAAVAAGRVINR